MPVLYVAPTERYKTIAIVEGQGVAEQQAEMLTTMRQKACAAGADALLVVNDKNQRAPGNQQDEADDDSGAVAGQPTEHKDALVKNCEAGRSGCYIDAYAIIRGLGK